MNFLYNKISDTKIKCLLCPNYCIIKKGETGFCNIRKNTGDKIELLTYNQISGLSFDPIEKKPLYHFYPKKNILSIGGVGCNLNCVFCQNHHISQDNNYFDYLHNIDINDLLHAALENKNNIGIAYTYNEPVVWYEFMYDTSKIFHKHNLKNIIVSNGLINNEPLKKIMPYIDAANIDLKSINDSFYKNYCKTGNVKTVLNTIETLYKNGIVVEVTNLIVTGLNDKLEDLKKLVLTVAEISKDIPLHFSRFFPQFKYKNVKPTDLKLMKQIYNFANKHLNYVYLGNIANYDYINTICPECGKTVVERASFINTSKIKNNKCVYCNAKIYGEF